MNRFIYDNEDILLELDGQNSITARYTHGPGIDEPLIMEKGSQSFFYHADGLGSITEITDSTGVLKQSYTYSSFGKIESQLDPNFIQPYTFTAREFDPETELYHLRRRTYNPNTGTFLQQDPIGFLGGINFYTYGENNPIIIVDPYGLVSWGLIRSSVTVSGGIAVGFKVKGKLSKVEVEASLIEIGNKSSLNLQEGLSVQAQVNAGVVAKLGKHEVGLKFGRERVTVRQGEAVTKTA